ncbi:hypothetical protein J5Y09_20935 [Roseomonas sp. PWR1]|uniref:Polysaccharide chain length determinant N-terminal domain-containing protein n=1 Tax=Roseomonas nitratireducens TaxID=2820810 RepID=A0ABS4B070_9PROT|nr:Wzz/FepE/Etk N-terminal domain-containing protein [Neoroseomonas nitratireducens]MBP0466406.1 hypothetical protein [Neoroseomonas nitratireducens]
MSSAPGSLLPEISLRDLAAPLLRRLWTVVAIVLAAILMAGVHVFLIRGDAWMAEAKILVRLGQEQAPLPTMLADRQAFVSTTPGHVNSEMELIRSRDLIALAVDRIDLAPAAPPPAEGLVARVKQAVRGAVRAVREGVSEALIALGLSTRLTPREAAIESLSGALILDSQPNTNVVTARLVWGAREVPEAALRLILDLYFETRAAMFQGRQAVEFFTERRRETGARLAAAEAALAAFERAQAITVPEEQRAALQRRLAEAETGLDAARLDLELAAIALRQLEATEAGADETRSGVALAGNPLQQAIASELASLGARSAGSQTTLAAQDAAVRRQRAEIAALSRQLAEQVRATHDQRRRILAARETLRDAIAADLAALQAALPDWQALRREVDSARRAFEFNDGKLNDALSVAALEEARIGNVQLVQRPALRATPVGLRKSVALALAGVLGGILALAWVAVAAFFDRRLHEAAEVERHLDLPVLAVVPRLRAPLPAA